MEELYANMNATQRGRFDQMLPVQRQQVLRQYQIKRTQFINANLARSRQFQQLKRRMEHLQGQATRSPAEEQELQLLVQNYQQVQQAPITLTGAGTEAQQAQAQQAQAQQAQAQRQRQRHQHHRQQLLDTAALRRMLATTMEQQDAAAAQQPADLAEIAATRKQADTAAAVRRDAAVQDALQQHDRDVADAQAVAAQRREDAHTKLEELSSKVVAIRAQLDEADPDPVAESAAGPSATSQGVEAECPICLDRPKCIVFQCGHQACAACAASIQVCHSCRAPITHRITPF